MRYLLLVVLIVLGVFILSQCFAGQVDTVIPKDDQDVYQVEWVRINPPPDVNGPCYAYFRAEYRGGEGFGYSGIYCKP